MEGEQAPWVRSSWQSIAFGRRKSSFQSAIPGRLACSGGCPYTTEYLSTNWICRDRGGGMKLWGLGLVGMNIWGVRRSRRWLWPICILCLYGILKELITLLKNTALYILRAQNFIYKITWEWLYWWIVYHFCNIVLSGEAEDRQRERGLVAFVLESVYLVLCV